MKIGDLIKFKDGHGWTNTVMLILRKCEIDMYLVMYSHPCDVEYPTGWHHIKHLEVISESR